MNGDEVIAKILKAEGVRWLGAFPYQTLIDAAAKEGIRPIICRQERAGVNMADGFSRVTNARTVGAFTMQLGPGAENAFSGVAQAFADSVPILLLPGGFGLSRNQIHPNFDAVANYRQITKWSAQVNQVERIPDLMRYGFSQLRHGRPGPVLLEIPQDIGPTEFPGELDYVPAKRFKSGADPDDVVDLVEAMLKASCPIINAGQGALWAEATDELVELAELTHIPVMTTLAGKSVFPENHALSLGVGAHSATLMVDHFLKKTDFVLGLGTSFTKSNFCAPFPTGVPLAQVTNCAEELQKSYPIAYGAIGDAKLVLRQMIDEVVRRTGEGGRSDNGKQEEVSGVRRVFMQEWSPRLHSDEIPISPYRVITELANAVDVSNTIITHDSGYPRDQLAPFWQSVTPRGYLGWGKSTQLGYGLGLALGAKLAAPEKQVINVMGDAAFGMAGMDLETAAREEIPILTVILNNGVMTHYDKHMPHASEHFQANQLGGNYAAVAAGLGVWSRRVDQPDELAPAITQAIEVNRDGKPALIEAMTKVEEQVPRFWQ